MNRIIVEETDLRNKNENIYEHLMSLNSKNAHTVLFLFDVLSYHEIQVDFELLKNLDGLRSTYKMIPIEDVWGYWHSWSLGDVPSRSLEFLKKSHWIDLYPELFNTVGCLQNPETHPEGDVFTHIKYAVDEAALIAKREGLDEEDRSLLVFSALCHDFGKQILSGNHEESGVALVKQFLSSIGAPLELKNKVERLTRYHSSDYRFLGNKVEKTDITKDFIKTLSNVLTPATIPMLVMLHEADINGRGGHKVFSDRISTNYRLILSRFFEEKDNLRKFTLKDLYEVGSESDIVYSLTFNGSIESVVVSRVNSLIEDGYLSLSDAKYFLPLIFNGDYFRSLEFIKSLDYRSTKKLADYIYNNGVDLDSLLLKGEDGIKEILNTPPG